MKRRNKLTKLWFDLYEAKNYPATLDVIVTVLLNVNRIYYQERI